jgi:hypothetical protein
LISMGYLNSLFDLNPIPEPTTCLHAGDLAPEVVH